MAAIEHEMISMVLLDILRSLATENFASLLFLIATWVIVKALSAKILVDGREQWRANISLLVFGIAVLALSVFGRNWVNNAFGLRGNPPVAEHEAEPVSIVVALVTPTPYAPESRVDDIRDSGHTPTPASVDEQTSNSIGKPIQEPKTLQSQLPDSQIAQVADVTEIDPESVQSPVTETMSIEYVARELESLRQKPQGSTEQRDKQVSAQEHSEEVGAANAENDEPSNSALEPSNSYAAHGNIVTCIPANRSGVWLQLYRLDDKYEWVMQPASYDYSGTGNMKIDGVPVDSNRFGAWEPYKVEVVVEGKVMAVAGDRMNGQEWFMVYVDGDNVTPWPCPIVLE